MNARSACRYLTESSFKAFRDSTTATDAAAVAVSAAAAAAVAAGVLK